MSAAINSSILALINAGIPLSGFAASITCAVLTDDSIVIDPTAEEEKVRLLSICCIFSRFTDNFCSVVRQF